MKVKSKLPVFYIPHGGGPWHVMEDGALGDSEGYRILREYLVTLGQQYSQKIKAVLVISAHWEEKLPTVHFGVNLPLLYDYYGFPKSTYHLSWSAQGDYELAERVENVLNNNGFETKREYERGFDHGTFVPLMVAFPEPKIPIIQLSLLNTLDPESHIKIGNSLELLRSDGFLIIGSGMSYHNLQGFMSGNSKAKEVSKQFDNWLSETVSEINIGKRNQKLLNWENAQGALECHPRSEHLTPLFVVAGAAGNDIGKTDYSETLMGFSISGFKFG